MTVPLCRGAVSKKGALAKEKKKQSFRLVRPRLRPPFFRTCVLKEGLPSECSFDGASANYIYVRAHVRANKKALRRLGRTVHSKRKRRRQDALKNISIRGKSGNFYGAKNNKIDSILLTFLIVLLRFKSHPSHQKALYLD